MLHIVAILVEDDFHSFFCYVGAKIVQNPEKSTIYEDFSSISFPFSSLSKNAQGERNSKSCLHEFADCRGAAVVL